MSWKYYYPNKSNLFTEKSYLYLIKTKKQQYVSLVKNKENHFEKVKKLKSDGVRYREIYVPDNDLKIALKLVNKKILSLINFPSFIHCGPKKRSIVTAVKGHERFSKHLALDIDSFFDNITKDITKTALVKIGFAEVITNQIIELAVEDNRLPQGFPTSSILSSLVVAICLEDFYVKFNKSLIQLSVYADDILLSSNNSSLLKRAEVYTGKRLKEIGLNLNNKKKEGRKGGRFLWLGLQIHPWVSVPRKNLLSLQKEIYDYKVYGILPKVMTKEGNLRSKGDWRKSLKGKLQHSVNISKNGLQKRVLKMLNQ